MRGEGLTERKQRRSIGKPDGTRRATPFDARATAGLFTQQAQAAADAPGTDTFGTYVSSTAFVKEQNTLTKVNTQGTAGGPGDFEAAV